MIDRLNPDALKSRTPLITSGAHEDLGALHGIPILLKDNIDTGDRMQTTAGSLALSVTRREDATVAAKLRARARLSWAKPTSASGPTSALRTR